jgi:hypothetical protein
MTGTLLSHVISQLLALLGLLFLIFQERCIWLHLPDRPAPGAASSLEDALLTCAVPQQAQMLDGTCAGSSLTLVSHFSQVFQVCFYPLNRSLIDAEGLFR